MVSWSKSCVRHPFLPIKTLKIYNLNGTQEWLKQSWMALIYDKLKLETNNMKSVKSCQV